jgi:hypothetical protein
MKSLRLLAFGLAIGVLAILSSERPASAGTAAERSSAPRPNRPQPVAHALTVGRTSQRNPVPARRPAPHHPSRVPASTHSNRLKGRPRPGVHTAILPQTQDHPAFLFAWRIGHSRSIAHSSLDDLVNSGRGPPRAGPQLSASRACFPIRRCVPCPALDSQVVLQPLEFSQHLQGTHPMRAKSPRGPTVPPRAVRHEGPAARLSSPSQGDFS